MVRISVRISPSICLLSITLSITGCSMFRPSASEMLAHFPTSIYSLTGEKLTGTASCEEAQAAWLARVDTDGDGSIDATELETEAKRLFALMDLNHDGEITAEELYRYRGLEEPLAQDPSPAPLEYETGKDKKRERPLPLRPSTSQPDPVLAADTNLDFKVSLDEFLTLQQDNIRQFDKNKDHRLDAQELNQLCRIREQAASPTLR
jgi:Ca2+-binding EF-hand superfamily protein